METDKMKKKKDVEILKLLLKDFTINPTISSLAKEVRMSRAGVWKVLKKLEKEKLVVLSPVGQGKTSTYIVSLNWANPLVGKTLNLALSEDALKNQRWLSSFAELENKPDFVIIYGSILCFPKESDDIDLLGVVSDKQNFREVEEILFRVQKTQVKKIHALNFTQAEFKQELEKPNPAFVDAIKKGVVLFGQENFIKFMKGIRK